MNTNIKNAITLFQSGQIDKAQEICTEIRKKDSR